MPKQKGLSVEQLNAIDALVTGATDIEAAEKAGVSRQTIWEWKRNPLFIATLNQRRQEIWEPQIERLRGLVSKAITVLEQTLESDDERLRLQAATQILKAVGLQGANLIPQGETDPEVIENERRRDEAFKKSLVAESLGW